MEYFSLHRYIRNKYTCSQRHACRTAAENGQEYLTRGKEYIDPHKTRQDEGTRRKTGVLVGLDLPVVAGN